MPIGLYFGSFNPIHIGHLIIANHILNTNAVNRIWFVVSPQNPFKKSVTLLNEYDRLHLVQKAVESDSRLKAVDIEFSLPKPSYTSDTLICLQEKYPAQDFQIVMGSDSYQNLHSWKNADFIVKHYKLIIYKRPGFEIVPQANINFDVVNAPLLNISATMIRKLIKEKKSIRYLVPDIVADEIAAAHHYQH